MNDGFDRYRAGVILWIGVTLMACGGGDKNKPQLGLVSPIFAQDKQAPLKQRREEVGIRLTLLEADIDCTMGLTPDLKFQNVSCPASLPQGRYTYRLEYYIKASNTLIAWVEDRFTLGSSDMDVVPELTFDINDDADQYNNFEEFLAGTNPRDASDYPPPLPDLTAPADRIKEASAEKTPVGLGEPTIVGFDETNVLITNDTPAEGFGLGETLVSWGATDGDITKTATQRITIKDTTAPVFVNDLPEILVTTTEDSITLEGLAVPEVTDIFAVEVISNAPASLTYALGNHDIVWTAEDANGNKSTKTQTLIVNQTPPPDEPICEAPTKVSIEARDQLTVLSATELGQASGLNFTGEVTVTHDMPATGFGIGDFTVTWTCADDNTQKTVTQSVSIINAKPVANAGIDQFVQVGDVVALDASASSDPNKDTLSYEWTAPVDMSLSSTTAAKPSFTVATGTKAGVLTFNLTVSDGQGGSASESMEMTILNTAPSAMAGSDQRRVINNNINLDGSGSSDPNGDSLTYRWSVSTAPSGSTATLVDPTLAKANFTPDVEGDYTLQLEVKDSLDSAIDSLVLTAIKVGEATLGMVIIAGGSFQMGDESSLDGVTKGSGGSDEVPVHTVTVATFEMGKYEVTFDEYDSYLISKGVDTSNITGTSDEGYDNGWGRGNRPVVEVSWNDIQGYLEWLNTQQGIALEDVKRYRLPTEAEWEYAARGGTTTAYSWGNTIDHDKANYGTDSCCSGLAVEGTRDAYLNTAPVGQFSANPFGLFDMYGNVWEWVEDCWHDSYTGAPSDGSAWVTSCTDASRRVLRGGSWLSSPGALRSATRSGRFTAYLDFYGFRLARTL